MAPNDLENLEEKKVSVKEIEDLLKQLQNEKDALLKQKENLKRKIDEIGQQDQEIIKRLLSIDGSLMTLTQLVNK